MKKLFYFIFFLSVFGSGIAFAQTADLRVLTKEELEASEHVPLQFQSELGKVMAACSGNAANDNIANAQTLVVNAAAVSGTVCGTLQVGEKYGCTALPSQTVWYKFVAVATTQYVQATLTSGSCYFGSVIYGDLGGVVPTNTCGADGPNQQYPISCQNASAGPLTQLHQLTNLIIGNTYYIQLTQGSSASCPNQAIFNIQVTSANPGGYITNPAPFTSCAAPGPGCYFPSPPTVATVTAGCTSYPLAASNYSANGVWHATFQYTNSATVSNVDLQAIITSNCFPSGNVVWFNWRLYDCSCNLIACATISNLTVVGLGCGTCYRFEYIMELANCSSFTTIWPFQNIPAVPIPCTVLPIDLLYFIATPGENGTTLEWKTASETGIKEFRVEKGTDEFNFKPLAASIPAVGSGYKYTVQDRGVSETKSSYYKLIAINNKGQEEYKKMIVLVPQPKHRDINLIPNPAENTVDLVLNESKTYSSIEIYNTLGQKVKSINPELQLSKYTIDISDLSKGIYFVNVISIDNEVVSKKLIKE